MTTTNRALAQGLDVPGFDVTYEPQLGGNVTGVSIALGDGFVAYCSAERGYDEQYRPAVLVGCDVTYVPDTGDPDADTRALGLVAGSDGEAWVPTLGAAAAWVAEHIGALDLDPDTVDVV